MRNWFGTYFINTMGPDRMALVSTEQGRVRTKRWIPIDKAVQFVGGKRWTISFIRFGKLEDGTS